MKKRAKKTKSLQSLTLSEAQRKAKACEKIGIRPAIIPTTPGRYRLVVSTGAVKRRAKKATAAPKKKATKGKRKR